MRILITSDLHITDKPEDEYKWAIWDWLHLQSIDSLIILGDLTEAKDNHSAALVNRLVDNLVEFPKNGVDLHILKGNHDYSHGFCPFFQFLKHYPRCYFHTEAKAWEIGNRRWAMLPHTDKPKQYKDVISRAKDIGLDYILMHQTFRNATSESGRHLDGCSLNLFSELTNLCRVFSGDVHVPQKVGPVEYIGAPYPVHFGDVYIPRVMLLDSATKVNTYLYPDSIKKMQLTITSPEELIAVDLKEEDQVKIVLTLRRSEFSSWSEYRKRIQSICKRKRLVLLGLELKEKVRKRLTLTPVQCVANNPLDQFANYCEHARVEDEDASKGRSLL